MISVRRGCRNVPGDGLTGAGCDVGVVGAVVGLGITRETVLAAEDNDSRADGDSNAVVDEDIAVFGNTVHWLAVSAGRMLKDSGWH
jgi:hypothetical protein